jgi:hypothetical protein
MTLLSTRDICLKRSGRYDLGTPTVGSTEGVDNGMDWFINEAVKFLDKRISNDQSRHKRIGKLAVDDYLLVFRQARTIENVWLVDESDGSTIELDRKTYEEIRNFYSERISVVDSGTPEYWCPAYIKLDPDLTIDDLSDFTINSLDEYVIDSTARANGIIIASPTDTEYTVEILGKFYSTVLENNRDENFWTESNEGLLVKATLYQIEVFHRNMAGARDFIDAIDSELIGVDMDDVMFDTEEINRMEG